jgi:hypothetical protein
MSVIGHCHECSLIIYHQDEIQNCSICHKLFHVNNCYDDNCFEDHLSMCIKCRKWVCPEFLDTSDVCQNCNNGRCIKLRDVQK